MKRMILTRPMPADPQQAMDKSAVRELVEFERYCRDNALWDEMKKCYAEDSHVKISWFEGTGHGFVDASSKWTERAPHAIHSVMVWLNGDKAVSFMTATIELRANIDGHQVEISSDATIIYRLCKIDGVWYIVNFQSIYEKDTIIPVFPDGGFTIPTGEIEKYRPSYAGIIYLTKQKGGMVNEELAGIDRPDLVEKIYNETDRWLQGE